MIDILNSVGGGDEQVSGVESTQYTPESESTVYSETSVSESYSYASETQKAEKKGKGGMKASNKKKPGKESFLKKKFHNFTGLFHTHNASKKASKEQVEVERNDHTHNQNQNENFASEEFHRYPEHYMRRTYSGSSVQLQHHAGPNHSHQKTADSFHHFQLETDYPKVPHFQGISRGSEKEKPSDQDDHHQKKQHSMHGCNEPDPKLQNFPQGKSNNKALPSQKSSERGKSSKQRNDYYQEKRNSLDRKSKDSCSDKPSDPVKPTVLQSNDKDKRSSGYPHKEVDSLRSLNESDPQPEHVFHHVMETPEPMKSKKIEKENHNNEPQPDAEGFNTSATEIRMEELNKHIKQAIQSIEQQLHLAPFDHLPLSDHQYWKEIDPYGNFTGFQRQHGHEHEPNRGYPTEHTHHHHHHHAGHGHQIEHNHNHTDYDAPEEKGHHHTNHERVHHHVNHRNPAEHARHHDHDPNKDYGYPSEDVPDYSDHGHHHKNQGHPADHIHHSNHENPTQQENQYKDHGLPADHAHHYSDHERPTEQNEDYRPTEHVDHHKSQEYPAEHIHHHTDQAQLLEHNHHHHGHAKIERQKEVGHHNKQRVHKERGDKQGRSPAKEQHHHHHHPSPSQVPNHHHHHEKRSNPKEQPDKRRPEPPQNRQRHPNHHHHEHEHKHRN